MNVIETCCDVEDLECFLTVIGRGGEQITRIQLESNCKIQIASGTFQIYNHINKAQE